jgi:hypothetical protein
MFRFFRQMSANDNHDYAIHYRETAVSDWQEAAVLFITYLWWILFERLRTMHE